MTLIELLFDAGIKPTKLPDGFDLIGIDSTGTRAIAYKKGRPNDAIWFLAGIDVNMLDSCNPVEVKDFITAYNLRNNPPAEVPEHHQTIEQLIAQMDTQADMAKRHTMEHIRLRDLIDNRLNPLGYYLTKK